MIFDGRDRANLKNLLTIILHNMELNGLDCKKVSASYKAFEWLQNLELKIDEAINLENSFNELNEDILKEKTDLQEYIEELKLEIEDLKKPKKKKSKK